MTPLRIGTRGSPLALWQAHHVIGLLRAAVPDVAVKLVEIETIGDQIRDVPLVQLGGEGAFTKAIQQARQRTLILRNPEVDHFTLLREKLRWGTR